MAADDGDGKTDLVVHRPSAGEWFVRFSSSQCSYGHWAARATADRPFRCGRRLFAPRRIGIADAHVDPQHLAEELLRILRTVMRIVRGAAVPQPDVEITVGSERQMAAVVIDELVVKDVARAGERQRATIVGSSPAECPIRRRD
jgi:hypothetical protein